MTTINPKRINNTVRDPNEEVTTSNTVRDPNRATTVTPLTTSVSNTSTPTSTPTGVPAGTTGSYAVDGVGGRNTTASGSAAYTSPQKADSIYLSQQDQDKMNILENNYYYYKGIGDSEAANQAHEEAERIRAGYGYSGGVDGAQYTSLDTTGVTRDPGYQASDIRQAQLQDDYINSMYEAQQASALQALKSAYDQNVITLDAQAARIPETYQAARNQTAAAADVNRANFNEYAAASGLNTGAGGQAQLAMNNQYLGDISAINQAEATAMNDLETQRTLLSTNYQNAIAQAIADGDMERASALYQEHVRVDEALVAQSQAQADENYRAWAANQSLNEDYRSRQLEQAQTLAAFGDFSGYKALGYTDEQIQQMYTIWAAQNPTLAWYLNNGYNSTGGTRSGSTPGTTTPTTQTTPTSAYVPGRNNIYVPQSTTDAWDTLQGMINGNESSADIDYVITTWENSGQIGPSTANYMRQYVNYQSTL